MPSFQVNRLKHVRVIVSQAEDEEKYEENQTNFEGAYLSDG